MTAPAPPVERIRRIGDFVARFPLVGPFMWISAVQYFLVQVIAASAWPSTYSWRLNAISDLGAIGCGRFDGRDVCSPLSGLMNASLVLLGLAMTIGSVLLHQELRSSRTGFSLMGIAGIGAILVGFFPEDTVYWAHLLGADLAFLVGNIALVVFGFGLRLPSWLTWYSIASGVVALIALALFLTYNRLFLGLGGMERVVAYPQTIWLVVFGVHMLSARNRAAAVRVGAVATAGSACRPPTRRRTDR